MLHEVLLQKEVIIPEEIQGRHRKIQVWKDLKKLRTEKGQEKMALEECLRVDMSSHKKNNLE